MSSNGHCQWMSIHVEHTSSVGDYSDGWCFVTHGELSYDGWFHKWPRGRIHRAVGWPPVFESVSLLWIDSFTTSLVPVWKMRGYAFSISALDWIKSTVLPMSPSCGTESHALMCYVNCSWCLHFSASSRTRGWPCISFLDSLLVGIACWCV